MATDKLIPQYLNKDEDARLVKNVEMTDALNIRVSTDDNGNQGVLKNVEGNSSVPAALASEAIPSSGTNRVIGSVSSEAGKCIYFFLYNSSGNHGIYQYRYTTDKYYKVYEDSVLNFNPYDFVKADVVINQFDEHLLYFTDNRNEPRKINATKALNGGYSSVINTGTDAEKELFLTVCKQPPQTPITFEFLNENNGKANQLKDNVFQFAYQYVYDDGEVSAVSAYSELAVSRTNLAYDSTTQNLYDSRNNALRLTLTGSAGPVDKIRILTRRGNTGSFYRITEVDNVGSGTQEFIFRNEGIYNVIPDQDAFKPFDSVPRKAFAQAISNNRLFYGNYTEGFDNLETDSYNYPVYHPKPNSFDLGVSRGDVEGSLGEVEGAKYRYLFGLNYPAGDLPSDFNGVVSYADASTNGISFEVDLSEITATAINSSDVSFNVNISAEEIGIGTFGELNMFFPFDVTTIDESGSVIQTKECRFCPPQYANSGITPPGSYSESSTSGNYNTLSNSSFGQSMGSLSNLALVSNLEFSESFSLEEISGASTSETIEQQIASQIESNIVGLTAVAGVAPVVINDNPSSFADDITEIAVTGQSNHTTRVYASDGSMDSLNIWFAGSVTYQIYEASFFEDAGTPKMRCKIRLSDVDLEAIRARSMTVTGMSTSPGFGTGVTFNSEQVICNINSQTENALGFTLKDTISGDSSNHVVAALRGYELVSASVRVTDTVNESISTSFKAGANHDFGVVYYDHRNRVSGVQKIDSVSVSHFNSESRFGNVGRSEIDLRILHQPPSWATKWAPVYSKNTTYERVLQTTIAEAGLPRKSTFIDITATDQTAGANERKIIEALPGGSTGVIFISMRTLEGKTNSYKESKGADLSYEFLEGDVLRILECKDSSGLTIRPGIELPITSYRYYADNEENPIQLFGDSTGSDADELNTYRATGWYLTVRDQDINKFDRSSVAAQTDLFSENCLVEIYRPKRSIEDQVFYEVGECYDIVEVSGQRTHGGDRSNNSSPSFDIIIKSPTKFVSSQRLYLGDKIITLGTNSGHAFITGIKPRIDGRYTYTTHESNEFVDGFINTVDSGVTISTTVGDNTSIFPGVVTLTQGDVYYRVREQLTNPKDTSGSIDKKDAANQIYKTFFIEDESVSDFFESKATSIGRPHIVTPDQQELNRVSSVTYSDVFTLDSATLNLSNFNPTLFPFKDYNTQHGDICYLLDRNEALLVMQEGKVSATPISRVLIESAGGGQLVTSQNVMGTPTYYAGEYGPGMQPEGVVERFGYVYFPDVSRAAVIRIGAQGLEPISAKHMTSYFQDKLGKVDSLSQKAKLPAGFDPDNDEYVLSISEVDVTRLSVPTDDGGTISDVFRPDTGTTEKADGVVDIVHKTDGGNNWDGTPDKWQVEPMNWEDVGNGIAFLDRLGEKGSVTVNNDFQRLTSNKNIKVSAFGGALTGVASVSLKDNSIEFPTSLVRQSDGATVSLTKTTLAIEVKGETVAWSTTKAFWLTFYSFVPELYAHLHDRFFSYVNGQIWKHNVNATYNNFYGAQYNSQATVVSKGNPSMVKAYDAISLEADNPWSVTVSNSDQATAQMASTEFVEKEGMWYRVMSRDETASSTSNTSHRIVLGQVASIDGTKITFSSRISNLPFGLGDALFKLNSSSETDLSLTISSVSGRKEITANTTVTGLTVGDTVMAVSEDKINGDTIRDYYAQAALTNASTGAVELYAVNMVYTPSLLHNEQ